MADQPGAMGSNEAKVSFNIQRIYLKDLSFESPKSPQIFKGKWQPAINLEINTRHSKVETDHYEVVLGVTVSAKGSDEDVAMLIELQQAGVFHVTGLDESTLLHTLGAFCPNVLFPYAREVIDSTAARGGFPALHLAPVNFDAIFAETLKRRAETENQTGTTH